MGTERPTADDIVPGWPLWPSDKIVGGRCELHEFAGEPVDLFAYPYGVPGSYYYRTGLDRDGGTFHQYLRRWLNE